MMRIEANGVPNTGWAGGNNCDLAVQGADIGCG